jgi:hypothetical protein
MTLTQSCDNKTRKSPKVDESLLIKTDIKIHRYGKALFEADTTNFLSEVNKMQPEFSLFLGNKNYTEAELKPLYNYVTDTQLISISKKVMKMYPDLTSEETQLSGAFSRYHYFFPTMRIPVVYSYVSNLYHEEPIIVNDSVVIIGLDVFLGKDFPPYASLGIPHYKIRCMTANNIAVDVMKELYIKEIAPRNEQKTLVDRMIAAGKLLYYLDAVLPNVPDSLKISYTTNQMKWVEKNKSNVWAFLVENKLFYSADYKIQTKLIEDGPFTAGFSNDSPPRLGLWLGWQIVRKYMDTHPSVSLESLINDADAQAIFNQSGYKP